MGVRGYLAVSSVRVGALALLALAAVLCASLPVHAAPMSLTPPKVAKAQGTLVPAPVVAPTMPGDEPPVPASVAEQATAAPVLTKPVKPKSRYNVVVFGDSLGDGVWAGLYHALRKDKRFNVIRKSKVATGFVRRDYYDWNEAVREVAADTVIDIAIVIMGTNDRQTIVEDGGRYALFTPEWRKVYEARVDDFTATLKATGARIYWVGLPVMRGQTFENDMVSFSDIFERRAEANAVYFLPTHDLLADEDGNYVAYREDAAGRKRLMRAEDGIHFTMDGYSQLVKPVAHAIVRDVDRGLIVADASALAVSAAANEADTGSTKKSAAEIGLKTQIYDMVESRPGRSDDWRWSGAAR
ncbi:MAG: DUF459 domain-containing protein [Parvibaculum sp.]|nr:DUF459 domain-containing protein [Parvibaculum sp.]